MATGEMEQKPNTRVRNFFALAILVGYSATLAVSSGHLAEWYRLTLGPLPPSLALALAVTLEMNAFTLSLLSNYTLRHSSWARTGAIAALGLVWLGNYLSMIRAAGESMPRLEVLASSLFVPIGTYVMGKVLGEILSQPGVPLNRPEPAVSPESLLAYLQQPRSLQDLEQAFPQLSQSGKLEELLLGMRAEGRLRYRMGLWETIQNS